MKIRRMSRVVRRESTEKVKGKAQERYKPRWIVSLLFLWVHWFTSKIGRVSRCFFKKKNKWKKNKKKKKERKKEKRNPAPNSSPVSLYENKIYSESKAEIENEKEERAQL